MARVIIQALLSAAVVLSPALHGFAQPSGPPRGPGADPYFQPASPAPYPTIPPQGQQYPPPAARPAYPTTPADARYPLRNERVADNRPVAAAEPPINVFQPAQLIARVGDQPIFLGDLLGTINQMLAPYEGKAPADEIDRQRQLLIKQLLKVTIENKLLYLEFVREFPQPDKLPEVFQNVYEQFNKTQLEVLMTKANVRNPAELDLYLRQYGSSLQRTKRAFAEQVMGQQMLQQNVNMDPEITHEDMLEYYRDHLQEFEVPAAARWEQLMVRFDEIPDKRTAYQTLGEMGNQVYLGGAALHAVARERSHGIRARKGGQYDWTTKDSLVSKVIDNAIFTLPVGRLSNIIEDDTGFHIIRVIERRDAHRIAFKAPTTVAIASYEPKADIGSVNVICELTNAGNTSETVELSLYVVGQSKQMNFQKSEKVTVPALGRITKTLQLEGVSFKQLPEDSIRVSIEPQDRIKALLREELIKQDREVFLDKIRDPGRTPVWTIFDEVENGTSNGPRQTFNTSAPATGQ